MPRDEGIPDYETLLAAYHEAFAAELQAMIAGLPIAPGDRVLEVACGDGDFARRLARHVGPAGSVTAVDISPAYLELARETVRRPPSSGRVHLAAARIEQLPFADDTFDLAWCAQSFYSLPDPVEALRSLRRVVRPGGTVAVLENDTLHHVLLPWPVGIELAVRRAELAELVEESDRPGKFYVGRRLSQLFRAAGFAACAVQTWASNRQAPLGDAERTFLEEYLRKLRDRVADRLDPEMLARFDRLLDPGSGQGLLDRPDFALTCIDHVVCGVKPGS